MAESSYGALFTTITKNEQTVIFPAETPVLIHARMNNNKSGRACVDYGEFVAEKGGSYRITQVNTGKTCALVVTDVTKGSQVQLKYAEPPYECKGTLPPLEYRAKW